MRWLEGGADDGAGPAGVSTSGPSAGSRSVETSPAARAPAVPVILVHGIPTSAELWRRVLPAIEGRALAWEMVGYGDSIPAGRGRDISVARQGEYLTAWLDALAVDRAILVGHDLGAGVVQRAAVARPGLAAGLVITNGVAYDAWPVWPMRLARRLHRAVRRLPDAVFARIFEAVLRRMHEPEEIGVESVRIHGAHYARHGGAEAFARQARSLDARDTRDIAHRVRALDVPARVVWGDADPFLSMELAHRLAADLGTEVRPISGARHFTPEDRPGPIARAINALVRPVRPG